MKTRPISITIVGWLFIAIGSFGIGSELLRLFGVIGANSAPELDARAIVDSVLVLASGALAFVGGAFALRGANWARWLLAVWMGAHIVISALFSLEQLVMHVLIFSVVTYFLFRPRPNEYFRLARARAD